MNDKNILITGIGGPTPRSIANTIRNKYPSSQVIGVDSNQEAIGFFMNGLIDKQYVAPRADAPDYWDFIHDLVEREKVDMAFVQPEAEVIEWGKYHAQHGKYPVDTFVPSLIMARTLVDKSQMSAILEGTGYIPKTVTISQENPKLEEIENEIGFPCWIRATTGSGGYGSLKIENKNNLESWLFIHKHIPDFTVSEYLPGRHLANQMLYYNGEFIKGASLECSEYVMANVAPSGVTGNTSYGRLINEDAILNFSHNCLQLISGKLKTKPHGVFSFDLKEDKSGNLKVTEINVRHMAYTGIMAEVGFDLVSDTIQLLTEPDKEIPKKGFYQYDKDYVFLRDVDTKPIITTEKEIGKMSYEKGIVNKIN